MPRREGMAAFRWSAAALRDGRYRDRLRRERIEASKGRFALGDTVRWRGRCYPHEGDVVQVLRHYGHPMHWKGLRVRGDVRECESYIVREGNRYWWPHAHWLELVRKGAEA